MGREGRADRLRIAVRGGRVARDTVRCLAAAVSLLAAPAASAAAPWSAPERVAGTGGALQDLWFADEGGGLLSAWCCSIFSRAAPGGYVAASAAGDSFSAWRRASRAIAPEWVAGSGSDRFAIGPLIGSKASDEIGVARIAPNGFGRPFRILPQPAPTVAVARTTSGTFAVVGQVSARVKNRREKRSIYLTVHRSGRFSRPARLAGRGQQAWLAAAVTPSGRALAAWSRNDGVTVRERLANGRLGPLRRLTRDSGAAYPTVALAPNGASAVAWPTVSQPAGIRIALRPAGGNFGPVRTLARVPGALSVRLAAYPDGRIQLAWIGERDDTAVVRAAQARGSTLGPVQTLSDAPAGFVTLATGRSGEAAIAWLERGSDTNETLRASVQAAGTTTFGAAETIAGPGPLWVPQPAFDPVGGRLVVAWEEGTAFDRPVFSASRDPIP